MNKNKVAIVQLCYADYEALEISLAAYTKLTNPNIHIFLLQNGRGTYDTERTYRVCQRYAKLFPNRITVVDWIKPGAPYFSIKTLLNSDQMKQYDYICKVDDDVFPITNDWIEKLIACYDKSYKKYGDKLGYVTSLVNNNPWGFKETVDVMGLKNEFKKISIEHYIGVPDSPDSLEYKFVKKGVIHPGGGGSVWAVSYYARWIHEKTTLKPSEYIKKTKNLDYKQVDNSERYSINCMLFKKDFWNKIDIQNRDDEYQSYLYCKENDKVIVADLSVPMCHICFFTQREENKDLLPKIREKYETFLNLNFPISLCPLKEYEIENRLRFIEQKLERIEHKLFAKSFIKYIYYKSLWLLSLKKCEKYRQKYVEYK